MAMHVGILRHATHEQGGNDMKWGAIHHIRLAFNTCEVRGHREIEIT